MVGVGETATVFISTDCGQRVKSWIGKSRTLENQTRETVNEV